MTTFIIIMLVFVGIMWIATKLKAGVASPEVAQFNAQVSFLKEYLKFSRTPACAWVLACTDKDDLLNRGQDKLW